MTAEVLDKARQLGSAIVASEEFTRMQLAQARLEADASYAALSAELQRCREEVPRLLREGQEEEARLLGERREELQQTLSQLPSVLDMMDTRSAFSRLMDQVNNVLQFTVTGEVAQDTRCSGNCGGCSGCRG